MRIKALLVAALGLSLLTGRAARAESETEAFDKGMSSWRKGDCDSAIAAFTEVIRLNQKNPRVYTLRGIAYTSKGEFDRAIADLTEAIRLDPKDAGAFSVRGMAYKDKGEFDKAIADQTEAIRLKPKDAGAFYMRGLAYAGKGELDKAISDYSEAIRLNSKDPLTHVSRGWAYRQKGDNARAEADYAQAKKTWLQAEMKILFLHGWRSIPGGVKPTCLKDHGHEVLNPALPDDDFDAALAVAQIDGRTGEIT